jgi:periplasmic protein CpxP/Spy
MKKQLFITLVLVLSAGAVTAQPGGFQRRTPEERTAAIHSKLDSAFKLDAKTFEALDSALNTLHRAQDKKMQELMAGGPGSVDRETMMAERQNFDRAKDEVIKTVLTEEQYKIWKEKIEPAMRPQRSAGGNN